MAQITADRVRDTSTTVGTGSITVSGNAPTGFRTFSAVLSVSDTFYYAIQGQTTTEWEVGVGTYSSANTFARTTVLSSSNAGSAVNLSAGTKDVFITLAAARTAQQDNAGNIAISGMLAMSSSFLRNRIINGAMVVDQRNVGVSQTYTAAAAIAYNVDRFYGSCTGANVTGQRTTGPSGFQNCYQFTGAASVTAILFGQRIESYNCADLVSQSVTLSANISNSLLTTVTWTAYSADSADSFSTKTQIATGTFTVSSTAATYQATFNAGANAANGIAIEFTVGAQTSGTWKITGVQLEVGTVATPFERRLITQEIQFCQRFYQKSYAIEVALGTTTTGGYASNPGHAGGTGNSRANIRFSTEMRAAPTLSYWDLAGTINRSSTFVSNNTQSNGISSASFSLTGIGTSGFAFNNAGGTGSAGTGAWASAVHWAGTSEL